MSIGFEETVVFEGKKGHRGRTDEGVTANLDVGRLQVPLDLHERIKSHVSQMGGPRIKPKYIALLAAGLRTHEVEVETQRLTALLREVRRILMAASEVDLEPRPRPKNVDPSWWAQEEDERIQGAQEDIRTALTEALRMLGEGK